MKIFADSDVIISSLISSSGAGYLLLHDPKQDFFISNLSQRELNAVMERLNIDKKRLRILINNRLKKIELKEDTGKLKRKYGGYVTDINDAHIVAGAKKAKAKFLVSYNVRHFKIERIKRDFKITIITPANLLQYLRSLN